MSARNALIEALRQGLRDKRTRLKDVLFFCRPQTLGLIKSHQQRLVSITEALKRAPAAKAQRRQKVIGRSSGAFKENYLFAPSKFED